MDIPLNAALAAEAMFCTADASKRSDTQQRLAYLAGSLMNAGSLHPSHIHLVSPTEPR